MDTWKTVKAEALKKYVQHYFDALDIKMNVEYADLQNFRLSIRNCQVNIDTTLDVSTPESESSIDDDLYNVMRDIRDYQKLCLKKTGIKLDPGILLTRIDPDALALRYSKENDLQALALLFLNDQEKKGDIEKYKRKLQEEYADEAIQR
jgi:hypothetical protein